jgi:hypothetical protein
MKFINSLLVLTLIINLLFTVFTKPVKKKRGNTEKKSKIEMIKDFCGVADGAATMCERIKDGLGGAATVGFGGSASAIAAKQIKINLENNQKLLFECFNIILGEIATSEEKTNNACINKMIDYLKPMAEFVLRSVPKVVLKCPATSTDYIDDYNYSQANIIDIKRYLVDLDSRSKNLKMFIKNAYNNKVPTESSVKIAYDFIDKYIPLRLNEAKFNECLQKLKLDKVNLVGLCNKFLDDKGNIRND